MCHDAATAESKKMAAHLVLLQRLFGHGSFRGPQASAILHWGIRKEDTVVVWRTGGGKTILFALTACLHPGLTVVVLPLISLINDMQRVLVKHNIRAAAMHSLMPKDRLLQTGDDLVRGRSFINVLLVTPEMMVRRRDFRSMLLKLRGAGRALRVVLDEAHCIIDCALYRAAYRELYVIRATFPEDVPILAMTGTATQHDATTIAQALRMRDNAAIIIHDTARYDIVTEVLRRRGNGVKAGLEQLVEVLQRPEVSNSKGIVFVATCRTVELVSTALASALGRHRVFKTHSEVPAVVKFKNESEWGLSTNGVIVATSTLGMGVNVMGCRFTVHYHLPSSLTAYQQEAGRSSRGGEGGFSFILFSGADERLWAVVHSEGAREDICKMGRFSEAELRERTSRETVEAHRRLKEVVFAFTFKHACLRVILRLGAPAVVSSPRLPGPCPAGTCSRCAQPHTAASDVSLHARFVIAVIADLLAAGKPCTFSNVVDVACMSQRRDVLSLMANVPIYQATHPARSGRLTPALTASLAEYVATALVVRGDVQMTVSVHEIVSSDRVDGDDDEVPTRRKIVFALSLHSHAKPLSPLYYHV